MSMYPRNLSELVAYLEEHPRVETTGTRGEVSIDWFAGLSGGSLWFSGENGHRHHIPIDCGRVAAETGIRFDAEGFVVTKFGVEIRVRYLVRE